jgi:SRSO17 transposase
MNRVENLHATVEGSAMTEQQLRELGPALGRFLDRFLFCCGYTQTFAHLGTYVKGLLSDLPRKSVEPIALAAGTPVRTLQEFLKDHGWDSAAVRDLLQRHVADLLPRLPDDGLGTVGFLDETSVKKQGRKTPGVQRQYLGCLGKVQSGIVTVHVGACKGAFKTLLDADLFLPEGWSNDRPRCREAGIPDDVVYRPKWRIGLGQLDRLAATGVKLDWLTFDEDYGKRPGFLEGLDERGQRFVGEVPRTFSCLAVPRAGRRPDAGQSGRPAEAVVRTASGFRGQPWRVLRLARQTLHDQVWRVKAAPVWVSTADGWGALPYLLLWASNDETGEEKFFLANPTEEAPVPVETLVRVGFRRSGVEHVLRVCKGELGLGHFEGRSYVALLRHLSLGLVAMTFVAEHAERLRGEKSGVDAGAGVPGVARGEPAVAGGAAAEQRVGARGPDDRVSPGTQRGGAAGQAETRGDRRATQEATAAPAKATKQMHSKIKVAL